MSFTWPEFAGEPIGDGRTWSATFDSYDERKDDVYYVVTLTDGESFMVCVSATFSGDQWEEAEVTSTLRARIAQVAATGKTNTDYRGPVMRM